MLMDKSKGLNLRRPWRERLGDASKLGPCYLRNSAPKLRKRRLVLVDRLRCPFALMPRQLVHDIPRHPKTAQSMISVAATL